MSCLQSGGDSHLPCKCWQKFGSLNAGAGRQERQEGNLAGDGTGGEEGPFTKNLRPRGGVQAGGMAEGEADTFSEAGGGGLQGCHALRDWCRASKRERTGGKGRVISDQGCKPALGQPGVTSTSINAICIVELGVTWGPGSEVE